MNTLSKATPLGNVPVRKVRKLRHYAKLAINARRAYMLGDSRQIQTLGKWATRSTTPMRPVVEELVKATHAWIRRRSPEELREAYRLERLRLTRPVKYAIAMIHEEELDNMLGYSYA